MVLVSLRSRRYLRGSIPCGSGLACTLAALGSADYITWWGSEPCAAAAADICFLKPDAVSDPHVSPQVYEILDNYIDEVQAGHATNIRVSG